MSSRITKAQLAAELAALRTENSTLRAQIDMLRSKIAAPAVAPSTVKYPLVDKLGRHYRMEGRIKCYQPS